MDETQQVKVEELVVLSKFEGDPEPENEFERVSIKDGVVVAHEVIQDGEVAGTVKNSDILGTTIGRLVEDPDKEVN